MNNLAGILAKSSGLQAGATGFGMGVGIAREHLAANEVFDEGKGTTTRRVIGIGDSARPKWPPHDLIVTDHAGSNAFEQR
jgi:hypothetical protein